MIITAFYKHNQQDTIFNSAQKLEIRIFSKKANALHKPLTLIPIENQNTKNELKTPS